MATNDTEDLSNLSDDEIEARQRAEDGEDPNHDPKVGEGGGDTSGVADAAAADPAAGAAEDPATKTDPETNGDPAATDAATDKSAADSPAGGEPAKVEGVLSKDGSRVLPYAALQAERRSARAANARAERTERELEEARQLIADMKAGKTTDTDTVTEADVADMEANFPEEGKRMRALFNRMQELEAKLPKAPAQEEPSDDPVQEAIDQVPLLLDWQHGDAEKFSRAQEFDAVLLKSPKWAGKPAVERFTEVARLVADEYDIPFPTAKSSASKTAATPAASPATAVQQAAQRKPPETLSDFKGGAIADHGTADVQRLSPQALLGRMQDMTDEELDAHLAKYG